MSSAAKPFVRGTVLHVDGETIDFMTARDAIATLKWLLAQDGVEAAFPCSWEIRLPASRLPEEIDFPGQMYGPCNALAVGTARGWHCEAGHEHVSGAQYYTEDEVAHNMQNGYLVPQDALYMDGREVW